MVLAAGLDLAHEALARKHDAVGHHLALGDGGAESPSRADQHAALGRFAQAAARGARVDERLNQHRHGGVGGRAAVVVHVPARSRGPQRGPAGAHGGEELGLARRCRGSSRTGRRNCAFAIFDQRGRAHRAWPRARSRCACHAASSGERISARSAARKGRAGSRPTGAAARRMSASANRRDQRRQSERRDLRAIGLRASGRSRPASASRRGRAAARFAAFGPTRSVGIARSGRMNEVICLPVLSQPRRSARSWGSRNCRLHAARHFT